MPDLSRDFDFVNFALNQELLVKLDELAYHCNRLRLGDHQRFNGRRVSRRAAIIYVIDHALRNGQTLPDLALKLSEHRLLPRPDLKPRRAKGKLKIA